MTIDSSRVPGSDDLRSLVDLIDSADRLRLLISGSPSSPGLLHKADEVSQQVAQAISSVHDVFVRLHSAASLESEVKELPLRLISTADSRQFRDSIKAAMSEEGIAAIESVRERAGEMAVEIAVDDLRDRLQTALDAANAKIFGSESFSEMFAQRKKAERQVKALEEDLAAASERVRVLHEADKNLAKTRAGDRKAAQEFAFEEAQKIGRKWAGILIAGFLAGVIASNAYIAPAVYEFVFKTSTPCAVPAR